MKDNQEIAKDYTDWMVKTGGFARDKTLRDEFAGVALRGLLSYAATTGKCAWDDVLAREAYKLADALLKERAK